MSLLEFRRGKDSPFREVGSLPINEGFELKNDIEQDLTELKWALNYFEAKHYDSLKFLESFHEIHTKYAQKIQSEESLQNQLQALKNRYDKHVPIAKEKQEQHFIAEIRQYHADNERLDYILNGPPISEKIEGIVKNLFKSIESILIKKNRK